MTDKKNSSGGNSRRGWRVGLWFTISLVLNAVFIALLIFTDAVNRRNSVMGTAWCGNFVVAENLHFYELENKTVRILSNKSKQSIDKVDDWTVIRQRLQIPVARSPESVEHYVRVNSDLLLKFVCYSMLNGDLPIAEAVLKRLDLSELWRKDVAAACYLLMAGDVRGKPAIEEYSQAYRQKKLFYDSKEGVNDSQQTKIFLRGSGQTLYAKNCVRLSDLTNLNAQITQDFVERTFGAAVSGLQVSALATSLSDQNGDHEYEVSAYPVDDQSSSLVFFLFSKKAPNRLTSVWLLRSDQETRTSQWKQLWPKVGNSLADLGDVERK